MSEYDNDTTRDEAPTRRDYMKYGGAVVGGGLLAGCSDTSSESTPPTTATADRSYTVEMDPAGRVKFDAVPERWESYFPGYADMGVALGRGDGLTAVGFKSRYHTDFYDELDGVEVEKEAITQLYNDGLDKELYYELGNDVHLTDPKWLLNNGFFGLEEADVEELTRNVAPFIGNTIFRRTDSWHTYPYYDMYGAFEKIAEVFRQEDRYRAFESVHDKYLGRVRDRLPPTKERPTGLLCFAASDEPEAFSPHRLADQGTNKKHFHDLGVSDALAETGIEGLSTDDRGQIDYETLLEVDPETLFIRGHEGKGREEFVDTVLAYMKNHGVASDLRAVRNDAVYRGGPIYQGPIQNLFLTERFATLLYPDRYSDGLFDRKRVANVVTGESRS